jgi:hypothetical protein
MKLLVAMTSVIVLGGCATGYHPMDETGGFYHRKLRKMPISLDF